MLDLTTCQHVVYLISILAYIRICLVSALAYKGAENVQRSLLANLPYDSYTHPQGDMPVTQSIQCKGLHLISPLTHEGLRKYMFKCSPTGDLCHVCIFIHRSLQYVPKLDHRRVCYTPELNRRGEYVVLEHGVCLVSTVVYIGLCLVSTLTYRGAFMYSTRPECPLPL